MTKLGFCTNEGAKPQFIIWVNMLSKALEFLVHTQTTAGGWGYDADGEGFIEPTAAVLLALHQTPQANQVEEEALGKAVEWTVRSQNSDGGWGICPLDRESGWQTAWAVYALGKLGQAEAERLQGLQWLLGEEVMQYTDSELLSAGEAVAKIDFSIRGWPWLPGESSWVEPSALTLLALTTNPSLAGSTDRVKEAVLYLRDRRCTGGGWNVGNPVMFDALFPARINPTAWAVLALAEVSPKDILPEDLQVLREEMHRDGGTMGFAWGLIALHKLGDEDAEASARLASLQQADGSWGSNPYLTATACLALSEEA